MARYADIAWAAGLFEGEGCFSYARAAAQRSKHDYAKVVLNTTDEDVIRRFHRIVKVGNVTGPRQRGTNKPIWQWQGGRKAAMLLVWLFGAELGARRLAAAYAVLELKRRG